MKKILFILLVFTGGMAIGQTKQAKQQKQPMEPADTIVKLGGTKILAYVKTVGTTTVSYTTQEKPTILLRIEKKQLEKIIYKNGRIDPFNKPVFEEVEEGQWQSILLTKDEKEVQGLYNRGLISAKSASNASSKKRAYLSATMKIQKLAANRKGSIVLITKEDYYGAFGDVPGCYLEGYVYGLQPLEEGTDVVNPDSKTSEKEDSKEKK